MTDTTILFIDSDGEYTVADDFATFRPEDPAEDRRVTNEADLTRLIEIATRRARNLGYVQQARLVSGPLLGQTQWLVQSTRILADTEPTMVHLEGEKLSLIDLRRLVAATPDLPDTAEIRFEVRERGSNRSGGALRLGQRLVQTDTYITARPV